MNDVLRKMRQVVIVLIALPLLAVCLMRGMLTVTAHSALFFTPAGPDSACRIYAVAGLGPLFADCFGGGAICGQSTAYGF